MSTSLFQNSLWLAAALTVFSGTSPTHGQALVPGTGTRIAEVGDDFEDPAWAYNANLPKVFNHDDTALAKNQPLGRAVNNRWYEGSKRGQPDVIQWVATPPAGLPGSTGALYLQSQQTGGNYPSRTQQQDDFVCNVHEMIGRTPVSRGPSVVTRVWLPPMENWERRSGCHFAFRIALESDSYGSTSYGRFRQVSSSDEDGIYWPGFFLNRDLRPDPSGKTAGVDRLQFWMKATSNSMRIDGPEVTQLGWWTLGLSVTPNGEVHYFAKPGTGDLTAEDHIASAFPFGYRAVRFRSFFFNVCSGDDGSTWSTPFIVDDSFVYLAH